MKASDLRKFLEPNKLDVFEKPKRLFIYNRRLFINYRLRYETWINEYQGNKPWHIWEAWSFVIGFRDKCFEYDSTYYDGHTYVGITAFYLHIAKHYFYISDEKTT